MVGLQTCFSEINQSQNVKGVFEFKTQLFLFRKYNLKVLRKPDY